MASQQEWVFSKKVEESNDKKNLEEDLRQLLGNGWIRTELADGIRKAFTFATVDGAVNFHSLVSSSSIKNRHHALLTLKGMTVSVEWTTHEPEPKGLSRLDYSMARICDIIGGALNNEWEELRAKYQAYTIPTQTFHFGYHSYVIDFVRAMGAVSKDELLRRSMQFRSTPNSVELVILDKDIRPELAIWLEFVKDSVIKVGEPTQVFTIEGEQITFPFKSVNAALDFHSLVHRCFLSKGLSIKSSCEGESVTVESHYAKDMNKFGNIIMHALSDNASSFRDLAEHDDDIPTVLYFAHHSKVAIFFRAVVIASKCAGPLSITSDYTGVELTSKSGMSTDVIRWLNFVLQNVVKPDPEEKVKKCGSSL